MPGFEASSLEIDSSAKKPQGKQAKSASKPSKSLSPQKPKRPAQKQNIGLNLTNGKRKWQSSMHYLKTSANLLSIDHIVNFDDYGEGMVKSSRFCRVADQLASKVASMVLGLRHTTKSSYLAWDGSQVVDTTVTDFNELVNWLASKPDNYYLYIGQDVNADDRSSISAYTRLNGHEFKNTNSVQLSDGVQNIRVKGCDAIHALAQNPTFHLGLSPKPLLKRAKSTQATLTKTIRLVLFVFPLNDVFVVKEDFFLLTFIFSCIR